MQATRKILLRLSLVFLIGLMTIPCAIKQQLKNTSTTTSLASTTKANAKACANTCISHKEKQQLSIEKKIINNEVISPFIDNKFPLVTFLKTNLFKFFFKEKVPSYLLHCLFRI